LKISRSRTERRDGDPEPISDRPSEAEFPLGDREAFVNDRDHFVDLFFADHERRAKLDRHKKRGSEVRAPLLALRHGD
jgi:hypothetical protein